MVAKCELKLIKHNVKAVFSLKTKHIIKMWAIGAIIAVLVTIIVGRDNLPFVMLFAAIWAYIEAHRMCKKQR